MVKMYYKVSNIADRGRNQDSLTKILFFLIIINVSFNRFLLLFVFFSNLYKILGIFLEIQNKNKLHQFVKYYIL